MKLIGSLLILAYLVSIIGNKKESPLKENKEENEDSFSTLPEVVHFDEEIEERDSWRKNRNNRSTLYMRDLDTSFLHKK